LTIQPTAAASKFGSVRRRSNCFGPPTSRDKWPLTSTPIRFAVGRLAIKDASIGRLAVDELDVGRLRVRDSGQ